MAFHLINPQEEIPLTDTGLKCEHSRLDRWARRSGFSYGELVNENIMAMVAHEEWILRGDECMTKGGMFSVASNQRSSRTGWVNP